MKLSSASLPVLITGLCLLSFLHISQAVSFEDTRCKCVCDKTLDQNGEETRAVYINTTRSDLCDCEHVVSIVAPSIPCTVCQCATETRNTTTIKVVVIFIICVVSLLFVYMLFLMCLDPIIQRRPASSYQPQTNEEEDFSSGRSEPSASPSDMGAASDPAGARQRSLINIVQKEQKKWKGTVMEQRKNIYDRHSMLN